MAYHFRFAAVLNYRRDLEELFQQKLVMAQERWASLRARLVELEDARQAAGIDLEERKRRPISAPLYALLVEGLAHRDRDIVKQRQDLATQHQVVTGKRRELLIKMQERQVMEKTRERDYEKYLAQERNSEQKAMDEQTVLRFKHEV